ncbi:MAG: dephospho-CoA kinase [Acidimicrobiaceae bacterium]|nr:dephospho-CoA kinase [Acidimicrobiaceae bacterium]
MTVIGCTGGIGSGKSSVTALLAERGASVLDADEHARRALDPGSAGEAAALAAFGEEYRGADGGIDRQRLAELVFGDPLARAELESIVHPLVREALTAGAARAEAEGVVAVLEVPLLVETGGRDCYRLDGVLVVDAPEELCLERLVSDRGMEPAAVRARMAAQAERGERLRAADFVILNVGTEEELALMVNEAWRWIEQLHASSGAVGRS